MRRACDARGWGSPRPGEHARYIYPCEWCEGRKFTQVRPGIVASTGCEPDPKWSQTDMQWQQEWKSRASMHAGGTQAGGSTTHADGLIEETFSITLPDGCTQGDRLAVALPDGRAVEIIVPQGAASGGQVGIRVPSHTQQERAMPAPAGPTHAPPAGPARHTLPGAARRTNFTAHAGDIEVSVHNMRGGRQAAA